MQSDLTPQAIPSGPDAVLLRFSLQPDPQAMAATQQMIADIESDPPHYAIEIAPGLVSVLVRFDPALGQRSVAIEDLLTRAHRILAQPLALPDPSRRWTIPVAFGDEAGPQLQHVAEQVGCSPEAAVNQICSADLRVLAIGYAPGQPYLGLLPDAWDLPRLSELTPNVPAGAVVVAVRQVVMFGAASATGWQHVGQSAFRSFDPGREEAMPLRTGDAVRFSPVSSAEIKALGDHELGGAKLEIVR